MCQADFFWDDDEDDPGRHHCWTFSIRNVTIERWWRDLRKMATQYWLDEFQALENEHLWRGDVIDRWALISIYLPLMQKDLERVVTEYNSHVIRSQRGKIRPGGRPDDLYLMPGIFGGRQCGMKVTNDDIDHAKREIDLVNYEMPHAVPEPVSRIISDWLYRNRVQVTRENAKLLYQQVRLLLLSVCEEDAA